MGLLTWLLPTKEERLEKVRRLMAEKRYQKARAIAARLHLPEAEGLYDECCKHLDKDDRAKLKLELGKQGFHGWKVEVTQSSAKRRTELEKLIAEELRKASLDLDLPNVDEEVFKAVVEEAQRRARPGGLGGSVRLVRIT